MSRVPKGADLAKLTPKGAVVMYDGHGSRRVAMTYTELVQFASDVIAYAERKPTLWRRIVGAITNRRVV